MDHWNQIASSTGKGVETVMQVYEDYLNVLMHHFVDTFTRPFELVEKNIGNYFVIKLTLLIHALVLKERTFLFTTVIPLLVFLKIRQIRFLF